MEDLRKWVAPIAGQRLGASVAFLRVEQEGSMVVLSSPPCSRSAERCWLSGMTGALGTKPAGLGR